METIGELVADAVADAEELFPPKPGGLVDRHRQRKAQEAAAAASREHEAEAVEQRAYKAVKVAPESPEVVSALTYTIAAGQSALVLPASPYRYRATVLVATAAATVTLAKDSGAALGQTGFALPANVPLPVYSRAQLWAFNGTASAVQVSVLAEIYAPEGDTALSTAQPAKPHHHEHHAG